MSAGMSVSETYRPPYSPKCPLSSGSLGATNERFELGMVLPSRMPFDPGCDVDGERAERAHHGGHALRPEAAGDEQPLGRQPGAERRVERDAGAARAPLDEAV